MELREVWSMAIVGLDMWIWVLREGWSWAWVSEPKVWSSITNAKCSTGWWATIAVVMVLAFRVQTRTSSEQA
jgi:hypothetical protein